MSREILLVIFFGFFITECQAQSPTDQNQEEPSEENPYKIFSDYGANVVRLRLWHNPEWTAELYEGSNNSMYNDLADVTSVVMENSTVFDFDGNVHLGIDYMSHEYEF